MGAVGGGRSGEVFEVEVFDSGRGDDGGSEVFAELLTSGGFDGTGGDGEGVGGIGGFGAGFEEEVAIAEESDGIGSGVVFVDGAFVSAGVVADAGGVGEDLSEVDGEGLDGPFGDVGADVFVEVDLVGFDEFHDGDGGEGFGDGGETEAG